MEGKVALEEHFSTELNNPHWNAKGEEDRTAKRTRRTSSVGW
jgi:gamma-resorcylate decarboxylase